MSQNANTEIVNQFYSALNDNDIPASLRLFAPDAERIEPENFPKPGYYKGLEEIKNHFEKARATWAEGACEPKEFIVENDKVLALAHVKVRLKENNKWVEGDVADAFVIREGKITYFRTFVDREEAMNWIRNGLTRSI